MNTHYHMTIAGCERDLPICPLNDKLSIGAFVIFGDCESDAGMRDRAAQKSAGV